MYKRQGWVSPGLETGVQESTWFKVCELIEKPELVDDPKFTTMESRRANQQDLLDVISDWASTKPKEEIYHTLQALRTITGYVATVEDLLVSQQFVYRQFFQSALTQDFGEVVHTGAPFRMDDSALELRPAPHLGDDNEEILCQRLGYSMEELGLTAGGGD